jgi:dTDP-4-dehydrorhamnose reductase
MIFTDLPELDLTDKDSTSKFIEDHQPEFVINCAAYTAVDKAETEKDKARLINVTAVDNLATICNRLGSTLIHISTDFVFPGNTASPLTEEDHTDPVNYYGLTKLEGEKVALNLCEKTLVIRTSWLYSGYGNNFVKSMLRIAQDRDEINVVFDQAGTPTYAYDLADTILKILPGIGDGTFNIGKVKGIYHYSNEGVASWYDFARSIFEMRNIPLKVNPILSSGYPTPARRPAFSVLDKSKIKQAFGIEIPYWKDSLAKCLSIME